MKVLEITGGLIPPGVLPTGTFLSSLALISCKTNVPPRFNL
jgi:hypothetical protein